MGDLSPSVYEKSLKHLVLINNRKTNQLDKISETDPIVYTNAFNSKGGILNLWEIGEMLLNVGSICHIIT